MQTIVYSLVAIGRRCYFPLSLRHDVYILWFTMLPFNLSNVEESHREVQFTRWNTISTSLKNKHHGNVSVKYIIVHVSGRLANHDDAIDSQTCPNTIRTRPQHQSQVASTAFPAINHYSTHPGYYRGIAMLRNMMPVKTSEGLRG